MENNLVQSNNELITMNNELSTVNVEEMFTNTLGKETKRAYVQAIKEFFGKDLCDISIEDMQAVTPEMANKYAMGLLSKGLKRSSINRKLSALHTFYKFLCRRSIGIMSYNPFDPSEGSLRFKNAQKNYIAKRALTADEVKIMIELAKMDETVIGVRDLLILELLATTGMRRAEICEIKIGDIQTTNGVYFVNITGKGSKERIIVASSEIMEIINKYMKLRGITMKDKDEYLLISHANRKSGNGKVSTSMIYRVVKHYAELADIDPETISPHTLRHTFATQCIGMGTPIQDVQQLMGHASINTTERYNHSFNIIHNNPAEKLTNMYND